MIATDTPEKESLAGPSGRRKIVVSETSSCSEVQPILSDHSSDEIDEEDLVGVRNKTFKPLERDPKVKEFVLVEFDSTPRIYYIGQIVKKRETKKMSLKLVTFGRNQKYPVSCVRLQLIWLQSNLRISNRYLESLRSVGPPIDKIAT